MLGIYAQLLKVIISINNFLLIIINITDVGYNKYKCYMQINDKCIEDIHSQLLQNWFYYNYS